MTKSDEELVAKETKAHSLVAKKERPLTVSATNFEKIVDASNQFDFTSFVKGVSRKNTALPKYIRDNWTIVLSIRNQLENDN